jgi:predicted DNA-binding ribbon-helix-helix protein
MKRSVALEGQKTSVSLEDAFWRSLREIARSRHVTLSSLLATINADRSHSNLSSAIRLFVLQSYRDQLDEAVRREGHVSQAVSGLD